MRTYGKWDLASESKSMSKTLLKMLSRAMENIFKQRGLSNPVTGNPNFVCWSLSFTWYFIQNMLYYNHNARITLMNNKCKIMDMSTMMRTSCCTEIIVILLLAAILLWLIQLQGTCNHYINKQ
jgi:hypothetical protein